MPGYLLLGITLLFYSGLVSITLTQPRMAGEAGIGYGLALAALGLGFALSSLLLTVYLAWKGGFQWISDQSFRRNLLVGLGWLCMTAALLACAVFKWEWHEGEFPQYLRWLARANGLLWIPLFMFIPYFMLLNAGIKSSVSIHAITIPLVVGFFISAVSSAGLLYGWLKTSAQQQAARMDEFQQRDRAIHQEHLASIARQKPTDPVVFVLALTGRFHEEDVRKAAVAKVREHPDWEGELIGLLDHESYFSEVYTFLDGNPVDHPDLFTEPLKRSILRMAQQIRQEITGSSNLQDWQFEHYGIERLLRALDEQFGQKSREFRPAIVQLREALGTPPPERFGKVRFTCTPEVDQWLKKHPAR